MITAADVTFAYDTGAPVLAGVDLHAHSSRVVGLIGPNGSGKTTLLRVLYAALTPHHGTVCIDDERLDALPSRELPRRMAVVAQESAPELPVSVVDMVLLGRSPHRPSLRAYTVEDHRVAAAALRRVGMRQLADRSFADLSGGERQRTLIARALAQQAGHLLLDEPTNHLDVYYQHGILELVRSLEVTTIVILHDLNLAARNCDEVILLDQGRVVKAGPTSDVLKPEILEPVYHVSVRVLDDDECVQLMFRPRVRSSPTDATSRP